MNRKISQLVSQALSRTRSVTRFGVLLLLCSPSLLLAHNGFAVSNDASLADQGDPALVSSLREHAAPLQRIDRDTRDDGDPPLPWPADDPAVRPASLSGTVTWFSLDPARLPDAPDFLQATLRAPPLA